MNSNRTLATRMLMTLLVAGGMGAATHPTLAAPASRTATANAVTGVWTGRFDGMIDVTATLNLNGANVTGTVTLLGQAYPVKGEWKAANNRLSFTYVHRNGVVRVVGVIRNGTFQGTNELNGQSGPAVMKRSATANQASASAATTNFSTPTPYVLKGTVSNAAGQPVPGVEVWADNTLYHNMNVLGKTDAQGRFVLRLPAGQLGTWRAGARFRTVYAGESFELDLKVDQDAAFAADVGAVRKFTLLTSGPRGDRFWGGTVWPNGGSGYDFNRVEYTFTPVGPLVDGSAGVVLKRFAKHNTIDDVPVGKYQVTARYLPVDGPPQEMQLKARDADIWASKVTITFRREPQYGVMADFDVRLPR